MEDGHGSLKSDSTFESRVKLEIGAYLPPPFSALYIREFVRRTESGGWLYSLGRGEGARPDGVRKDEELTDTEFMDMISRSIDLRVSGDLSASTDLAVRAVEIRPGEPSAWHTLAMVSSDLGRYAEALFARRRAVELLDGMSGRIPPEMRQYVQQCVFGYATSLMLHGRWAESRQYWEAGRLGYSWCPPVHTAYWQGQSDGGLLVVCEGGYGDLFLFSRFLPLLSRRYPGKIGLFVHPGLRDFRDWRALGADEVFEIGDPYGMEWTYSTGLMGLPGLCGIEAAEDVPSDRLSITPDERDERDGIGFCWRSEEFMTKRRFRSLSENEAAAVAAGLSDRLGRCPESLCPSRKDLASPGREFRQPEAVNYTPSRMQSWSGTAQYIAGMRMVVTVDTAVAHLAGLLNVPTLLLLPLNVDWKFGIAGEITPWYPNHRLFRNPYPLHWDTEKIVEKAVQMYRSL